MIKFHWVTLRLYLKTHEWCKRMRKRLRTAGARSSWWSFIWMGLLKEGFHFLGVNFSATRTAQGKIQVAAVDIHPRTCRRALDRVALMQQDAVHPAKIQRYLSLWAIWWKSKIRLEKIEVVFRWVSFTADNNWDLLWYGRGLLMDTVEYCLSLTLPYSSNQNQIAVL